MKHVLILPDLGQTTSEAKVLQWHKKLGDKVRRGEPILEVETDKVDMDVESYIEGYLRKTLVAEGDMATALAGVAILTDTPDEDFEIEDSTASKVPSPEAAAPEKAVAEAAKPTAKRTGKVAIAPAAKKLAEELNVDPADVTGTGPNGLITRKDLEAFVEKRGSSGAATAAPSNAPRALAAMAAIVSDAKKTIPHFYLTRDLDVEAAAKWRAGWNEKHPAGKATFNDIFVLAAAKALRDMRRVNTTVRDGSYEQHKSADIVLVVAEDEGLTLVPVADPCDLGWPDFIQSMRKAAQGAQTTISTGPGPALKPALAVSNLGMFQVESFSAIIPPGCSSVLAIGSVTPTPVVEHGQVVVRQRCKVTISADHRVIDGVTAAKFMDRIQQHLSNISG